MANQKTDEVLQVLFNELEAVTASIAFYKDEADKYEDDLDHWTERLIVVTKAILKYTNQ